MKTCTDCHQEKPLDEFYKRSGMPHLRQSVCKSCMKDRYRTRRHTNHEQLNSTIEHEQTLIDTLIARGIPALPGKALSHKYADIVAFGCIMIEAKLAMLHKGQYRFTFTPQQRQRGLRADVIVLVIEDEYYLFEASHAAFYRNGKLKGGVTYTPGRSNAGRKASLSDDVMNKAHNNWQLITNMLQTIRFRKPEEI